MAEKAVSLVRKYLRKYIGDAEPTIFVVWQTQVLQNFKCSIAVTLPCWMHFELTYDGDRECWYLDAYDKVENLEIPDD